MIQKIWKESHHSRETLLFLHQHKIVPSLAAKLQARYGSQTMYVLKSNPYVLGWCDGVMVWCCDVVMVRWCGQFTTKIHASERVSWCGFCDRGRDCPTHRIRDGLRRAHGGVCVACDGVAIRVWSLLLPSSAVDQCLHEFTQVQCLLVLRLSWS